MNRNKLTLPIAAVAALQLLTPVAYGQQHACEKTMEESLQQVAETLNKPESKALWNITLNAPVIIVDHFNNRMFFTAVENANIQPLREEEWNNTVPLANSVFEHEGKRHVTIVHAAFMNASCEERVNLLSHEIFHLYQKDLGIENGVSVNYHMDEAQGRALLQIEMKALQQFLSGEDGSLSDALCIRACRQRLYPDNNEDLYELNEGLAEYTGAKLSTENMREYVKRRLNYDVSKGYTNAFGYYTGSAYAVVLDELYPEWRYDRELTKGLVYLIKKAKPQYAAIMDESVPDRLLAKYGYDRIVANEEEELKSFGDIAQFKALLNPDAPKVHLSNQKINFTYNPNDRVISLGDAVLLRNMTVTGEWGQINAKSGIVRLNNWSAFYLLPPAGIAADVVRGDNYEIKLNPGWKMIEENGIYRMVKE
ncbi:MAG: hypothetical protein LBL07_19090 [Tannerella sp.]|nr:hypothetical protein [Tannerella sp.]